jgi:hypothetical protein
MKQAGFNPLAIDVGNSTRFLDMKRVGAESLQTWEDIRDCLHDETLLSGYDAIILDDLTKVEELAAKWVVQNVPHQEKESKPIKSIEDYGWGKGYSHIYDAMLLLLQDLDAQIRKGRWVVCVAHECTNTVPNPSGEDWIRYEPRLQSPASGKASVRLRVKEWVGRLSGRLILEFIRTRMKFCICSTELWAETEYHVSDMQKAMTAFILTNVFRIRFLNQDRKRDLLKRENPVRSDMTRYFTAPAAAGAAPKIRAWCA